MEKEIQKIDFQTEEEILRRLAFDFELAGVKSFFLLEKEGKLSILDAGLSGKSIVDIIMYLAEEHRTFFLYALQLLKNAYEEIEDQATIH